jgi:hypothetical protein
MRPFMTPLVPCQRCQEDARVPRSRLSANYTHATCRFVSGPRKVAGAPAALGGSRWGGESSDLAGEKSERSAFPDQIEQTRRECERIGVN